MAGLRLLIVALFMATAAIPVLGQEATPKPLVFERPFLDGPVYVVPIEGTIDNALAKFVGRAISDAEGAEASLLLFHIDTFGGLVNAADDVRQQILKTRLPTLAFIDKNAASAGALISYAADRIVMVPGASIGAATVVEGVGGDAAPDKYQSYMRGLMRSTAEANGRDPRIAEAMVDESLEIEGISEAGRVLTLSTSEAVRHGVADFQLDTVEEILAALELTGREMVWQKATRTEQFLRFFGSPILQSILILMMLGGLYFELQTPGVGFAGLMSVVGAALFFAPHYLMGLVESWEIVLFGVGVVLILAEVFVIPGFGVAGIGGLIMVVVSLVVALIANVGFEFPSGHAISSAIGTMAVTMVLLVLLIFSVGRYLPRSQRFNLLVLAPELSSARGYVSSDPVEVLLGAVGTTVSTLRPAGTAEFDGERIEVTSGGELIPAGAQVQVVRVRGSKIEVRPVVASQDAAAATSLS